MQNSKSKSWSVNDNSCFLFFFFFFCGIFNTHDNSNHCPLPLLSNKPNSKNHGQEYDRDQGHCERVFWFFEVDINEIILNDEANREEEIKLGQDEEYLVEISV